MIKIGAEIRDKIGIGMIVNMDFAKDDLERPNWSRYLQCCLKDYAQDDLERPNWSRYLQCCLNFKINRFQ